MAFLTSGQQMALQAMGRRGEAGMSDFCRECSQRILKDDRSDIRAVHYGSTAVWDLCEGCGMHLFDRDGMRACGVFGELTIRPCPICRIVSEEIER